MCRCLNLLQFFRITFHRKVKKQKKQTTFLQLVLFSSNLNPPVLLKLLFGCVYLFFNMTVKELITITFYFYYYI